MLLTGSVKKWLEARPWYIRLRYARPVLAAWLWFRPSVKKKLDRQKKLYLSLLSFVNSSSRLVFDIGAHEGFLTGIFRQAGHSVVAAEPAPRNIAILKRRFEGDPGVAIVAAAVSARSGEISFYEAEHDHAFGTASKKWKEQAPGKNATYKERPVTVETVTLDQLIRAHGTPVFIKIDVEGHEESAVKGLSAGLPLLSFEAILPAFKGETENCIAHLEKLGEKAVFNFAIDDQLQWEIFKDAGQLIAAMRELSPQTIEIFCKM